MTTTTEVDLVHYPMFIGGEWVDSHSGAVRESVNPTIGRPWATVPEADAVDVDRAVRAARLAFDEGPWSTMTGKDRARRMRRLGELPKRRLLIRDHLSTPDRAPSVRRRRE